MDLFYAFNTPKGEHHIVPASTAMLITKITGKHSTTVVRTLATCYEADPSTLIVCTMARALQDRTTWGKDQGSGHDLGTALISQEV